ncbi:MAG: CoA-binding protein [Proteobacteria bacterium]|nr:CoA-binding protein [Pseudomonadota bacterium]MBU4471047.1 CoA-binding protein [Pseudomonadota bacterium]MCG2753647.1 CoA-binding protein [Desulfobacteraceae bacterium]
MVFDQLEEILHPGSIAVIGATTGENTPGNGFVRSLVEYGFKGSIYPVNPKHSEIAGLAAYKNVKDIEGPVDYVISSIPAHGVLDMIQDCGEKRVKAIHLFTARFSETGRKEGIDLEKKVLAEARKANIRLIGPNCMGLFYPAYGISFSDALPKKGGTTGFISQSGQMAEDVGRYAALRGVFFSKAISYGNAIDFNECDFLEYMGQDPATERILMYVEGVRDGLRLSKLLKKITPKKPVIILKGGTGESGTRMTSSHTASMAGSRQVWQAMVRQAGGISADSMDELLDIATSFTFLPKIEGFNVGIAGGGGGASVLAADLCEAAGLKVIPLPAEIREELKQSGSKIWDWIDNPADMSIRDRADFTPGHCLELMAKHRDFHLLAALMMDPHHEHQRSTTLEDILNQFKVEIRFIKPMLAVVPDKSLGGEEFDDWKWEMLCRLRTRLMELGIPFYPTIGRAARAATKMAEYYQRVTSKE